MIQLNCDIGESFGIYTLGKDEQIFPLINMANLACGFHSGDSVVMQKSVALAKRYDVTIGAHISYQDLVGFGRRSMNCTKEQIKAFSIYQIGALSGFCKIENTNISYVKPHGALYNDMMKDNNIFEAILEAISSYDTNIKLMILSTPNNNQYKKLGAKYNIELIYEVFADRNYTQDGYLVSRDKANAIIDDKTTILNRIDTLKNGGYLTTCEGDKLYIQADTICVHSDNDKAIEFIKLLKNNL
jgi:UPF0271 protein